MSETNTNQAPSKWFAVPFIALGIGGIIINPEPAGNTPEWVLQLAFGVFAIAGVAIVFPKLGRLLGLMIVISFALIATWIGFSPDATGCTSTISIPYFSRTKSTGCGAFSIMAVFLWICVIAILIYELKRLFFKKEN